MQHLRLHDLAPLSHLADWDVVAVDFAGQGRELQVAARLADDPACDAIAFVGAPVIWCAAIDLLAVRRSAWEHAGGLDDRIPAAFRGTDLAWRLGLLGYRLGWHDAGSLPAQPGETLAGLGMAFKYLDSARGSAALTAIMTGAIHAPLALTDTTALDLQRSPGGDDVGDLRLPASTLAGARAVDRFTDTLGSWTRSRDEVYRRRRVPDAALRPLLHPAVDLLHRPLRAVALGEGWPALPVTGVHAADPDAPRTVAEADVVLTRPEPASAALVADTEAVVVVDLPDDPTFLAIAAFADRADVVCCRTETARDVAIGVLAGRQRINAANYDADPTLRDLVRVVDLSSPWWAEFVAHPLRAADHSGGVAPLENASSIAPSVPDRPVSRAARLRKAIGGRR